METQKKLPNDFIKKIKDIELDHIHGSTFLAKKSIDIIVQYTKSLELTKSCSNEIKMNYAQLFSSIIKAQPQMGLIFTIANDCLVFLDSLGKTIERDEILSYLKDARRNIAAHTSDFSTYLESIIQENDKIITYSSSSSIINSLVKLSNAGFSFQVLCSESRPKNEGIATATKLADHSIPITLCTDAYLFSQIDLANIVLIGTDAICSHGVVNKIGSSPLIRLANKYEIPCYVLSDTRKILPETYELAEESLKPDEEVIDEAIPENLSVINKYFDFTPLDLFTYVISEKGFISIQRVKEQMKKKLINKELQQVLPIT